MLPSYPRNLYVLHGRLLDGHSSAQSAHTSMCGDQHARTLYLAVVASYTTYCTSYKQVNRDTKICTRICFIRTHVLDFVTNSTPSYSSMPSIYTDG